MIIYCILCFFFGIILVRVSQILISTVRKVRIPNQAVSFLLGTAYTWQRCSPKTREGCVEIKRYVRDCYPVMSTQTPKTEARPPYIAEIIQEEV